LEHEADRSPPSAEVKESGAIPPRPLYAFMAWCSVKAQGQLYLYLYRKEKEYLAAESLASHFADTAITIPDYSYICVYINALGF